MNKNLSIFIIMLLVIGFGSCNDELLSPIPVITYLNVTPTTAVANQDEIVVNIMYQDGDGDLGENTSGVKNVFVTDSRNNVTYQYRLSQLAPDNTTIAIQGEIGIHLNKAILVDDQSTTETATFSVYVVDRAGNQSNTITTDAITINK